MRDEFLSEEDLDIASLSFEERVAYWNLWLRQAQATNHLDARGYSHGVMAGYLEPLEESGACRNPSSSANG